MEIEVEVADWAELRKKQQFAVALLLWSTASSDGAIKAIERADITQALMRNFDYSRDQVDSLLASVDRVKSEPEFLKTAIADLSQDLSDGMKGEVYNLSCRIALSDRKLGPRERAFLDYVGEGLRQAA